MHCAIHRVPEARGGAGVVQCSICMTNRELIAVLHSVVGRETRTGPQRQVCHFMCSNCYFSHSNGLQNRDVRCTVCRDVRVFDTTRFICVQDANARLSNGTPDLYFDPQTAEYSFVHKEGRRRRTYLARAENPQEYDWSQVSPEEFVQQAGAAEANVHHRDEIDHRDEVDHDDDVDVDVADDDGPRQDGAGTGADALSAQLGSMSIQDALRGATSCAGSLVTSVANEESQTLMLVLARIHRLQTDVMPYVAQARQRAQQDLEDVEAWAMDIQARTTQARSARGRQLVGMELASQVPDSVSSAVLAAMRAASGGPRR